MPAYDPHENDRLSDSAPSPQIGIRREGDGCFHAVEEVVPEGYIVDGILVRHDEVVDIIECLDEAGGTCSVERRRPE
jgi:hypothetical protein